MKNEWPQRVTKKHNNKTNNSLVFCCPQGVCANVSDFGSPHFSV
jgi:hypothetical protein